MTTGVLWGQAGTLSFVPLSDAPNGLKRIAVKWDSYTLNQQITAYQVEVFINCTDLLHIDRDAILNQTFGLANVSFDLGPSGYSSGSRNLTFRAANFNTSTYPGPQTLFVINYVGTPDCVTSVDTTVQFTWGTTHGYFSGTYYSIPTGSSSSDTFSCNYIQGLITSPFGDPACEDNYNGGIEGVNVAGYFQSTTTGTLVSPTNVNLDTHETLNDGGYLLDDMPSGVYVKVRPSKLNGPSCGISTSDLNDMNNYILGTDAGIAAFQYPWQLIAGDVNYNDTMTTFDVSLAGQMMIDDTTTVPVNSWTFIPQNVYDNLTPAPDGYFFGYPYSEEISFSPLDSNYANKDYYGIKRGDIDGSCEECSEALKGSTEDRSGTIPVVFSLTDQSVRQGELITLPVQLNAAEPMNVMAFEIRFDADKFEFEGIQGRSLPLANAIFKLPEEHLGVIRFVWFNPDRKSIAVDRFQNMFSVALRAKTSLSGLQRYIQLTDFKGNALYGLSNTAYHPEMRWISNGASLPVFQVTPSPFVHQVRFSFEIVQAEAVTLRVVSTSGALMHEYHSNLEAGLQYLSVESEGWPAGIYLYDLQFGKDRKVGRIVKQ